MKTQRVSIVADVSGGKVQQVRIVHPPRMRRKLVDAAMREAIAVAQTEIDGDELKCRYCGCTQDNACIDLSGESCHWIDGDVCSATPCRMAYAYDLLALASDMLGVKKGRGAS
jgi:hypothetical protein